MKRKKNSKIDLKLKYKLVLEIGFIISLVLCIILFQAFKKFEAGEIVQREVDLKLEVEDIPQTEQQKLPPPPSRPLIPIESENDDIPEDETIEITDLDLTEIPTPPAPPSTEEESAFIFIPYDSPPEIIGGRAALERKIEYPDIARKAGVEGKVIVYVHVNEKGNVINTRILRSLGNNGCDEAAVKALKSVKWKPAMQRDRPVKVWVSFTVNFTLR